MTRRLLPLPSRINILLRSRIGPLLVLALAAAAISAIDLRAGAFSGAATGLVLVIGLPLALTTVGADLRRGVAPLWVQKPVEPVRFYLARFGEGALASVGLSVVVMSIMIPVALWSGWEPVTHPLRLAVVGALVSFVLASVAFGFCVLLPRAGQLATITLLGITVARDLVELLDPVGLDWLGSPAVRMILFPLTPLVEIRAADGVEPESLVGPLAWVFCYAAAWIGIGAIGIRRAFSGGAWARSS